jgi:hypothetical protein
VLVAELFYASDPAMVVASTSMVNHDCIGAGVLVTLNNAVRTTNLDPAAMTYSADGAPDNNR